MIPIKKIIILFILLAISIYHTPENIDFGKQHEPINEDWLNENFQDITLEIYYISPYILTRFPWTEVDLMRNNETLHITVDADVIKEQKGLLCQMLDTSAVPVSNPDEVHLNARVYYALCDTNGETLFEVAMWGLEEDNSIFINGTPCVAEPIFYDVAMAFLPSDARTELARYIN